MRRLPPQLLVPNLQTLIELMPDHTEDLLSLIDQPLKIQLCPKSHTEFLICDYNRDGESFRSPWSNEYVPPLESESGIFPSEPLRKLEIDLNEAFSIYRQMYYEGASLTSVYLWSLDNDNDNVISETPKRQLISSFAAAILVKKTTEGDSRVENGGWDAIHIFEITPLSENTDSTDVRERKKTLWSYKLTTTILLYLVTSNNGIEKVDLSGNISRRSSATLSVTEDYDHIGNIGRSVEEMENKMRSLLQDIYFGKTRDVVNELRTTDPAKISERFH